MRCCFERGIPKPVQPSWRSYRKLKNKKHSRPTPADHDRPAGSDTGTSQSSGLHGPCFVQAGGMVWGSGSHEVEFHKPTPSGVPRARVTLETAGKGPGATRSQLRGV